MLIRQPNTLGIYIHYPYCLQKCHYCDFFSEPISNRTEDFNDNFVESIRSEFISRYNDFSHLKVVDSIFFGGGTASLLSTKHIHNLINFFGQHFSFSKNCEITLEGNPENINLEYLKDLEAIGVNRINVGIQTFAAELLTSMNRYFDLNSYNHILDLLSMSSIRSRGVDLMYGLPGQTEQQFFNDLQRVVKANLEHLSIYSLIQEPNTMYSKLVQNGLRKPPNENLQDQLFQKLPSKLSSYGFQIYEVSNYSKPDFECRHNLRYWLYEPYMGLGPGAHGFDGRLRYGNLRNIQRWQKNTTGATKEPHKPEIDVPLNLFRIAKPFQPKWFADILNQEVTSQVLPFFEQQEQLGYGNFLDDNLSSNQTSSSHIWFQWNLHGLTFLDSIIESFVNQNAK